jgi:hypothetical protein
MNKRTKILVYVLLASIALAFIVFGVLGASISSPSETANSTPISASSTATSTAHHSTTSTHAVSGTKGATTQAALPPIPAVIWTYKVRGKDPAGQAYADVTVEVNGNPYELGTFPGTCSTLTDDNISVTGELSAARCLTGSEGSEIGVFRQGSGFVIKKATFKSGTQGNPDQYGAFTVVTPVS